VTKQLSWPEHAPVKRPTLLIIILNLLAVDVDERCNERRISRAKIILFQDRDSCSGEAMVVPVKW